MLGAALVARFATGAGFPSHRQVLRSSWDSARIQQEGNSGTGTCEKLAREQLLSFRASEKRNMEQYMNNDFR